jgi:hypothetical protein
MRLSVSLLRGRARKSRPIFREVSMRELKDA